MIYKLVSSKAIVAKLLSDLDIQDEQIRITDIQEWIGEAYEKIGCIKQYNYVETGTETVPAIPIVNYQAQLPADLHVLDLVAYSERENGPWYPMRSNTSAFKLGTPVGDMSINEKAKYVYLGNYYPVQTPTNPQTGVTGINVTSQNTDYNKVTNYSNDPQYFIKPGYIVTTRKGGYLKLAYYAVPLDDEGYPMIPDLASFSEAIYWYVVLKLKYPEYMAGRMQQHIYYDIRNNWNFFRKQAYGEAMMPTAGEMISIKNQWNKLLPEFSEEEIFYSGLGNKQNIYNNYYGRLY